MMLYKFLVSSARWHDLGHALMGFVAGVFGPYVFALWVIASFSCDLFIDKHPLSSAKLYLDLSTKIIPAAAGLLWYYHLKGKL